MISEEFAEELRRAAENVANHTVELVSGVGKYGTNQIWRCTKDGSSIYGFDLVISRFGIAMYGDVDSLVFKVGSSYGIEFLARKSVCSYMIGKLESEYREKRQLCEKSLRAVLTEAGCRLLEDKFVPYVDDDTEEFVELPDWIGSSNSADITLEKVIEEMEKHAPEQPHQLFEGFEMAAGELVDSYMPDGLQAVNHYLADSYRELYLGSEWYEHNISMYDSNLIQRLEMLRLCAIKIQEMQNAGNGAEEQPI